MKAFKIFLISSLFWASFVQASDVGITVELEKKITKEFPISSNGKLHIHNKYGKIQLHNWENDDIKFEIVIITRSNSEKKARERLETIDVNFDASLDLVSAVTQIEEKDNNWFTSWWGSSSNVDYEINYNVWAPASLHYDISHSYGNIDADLIEGSADIDIRYGDVRAREVSGELSLSAKYGDASISTLEHGNIGIKYGEFYCEQGDEIKMNSGYSKVVIKEINHLNIKSKYDSYSIGKCGSISNVGKYDEFDIEMAGDVNIKGGYTNIYIDYLDGNAEISNKYATITINKLGAKARKINVSAKYSTLKLDKDSAFNFEAQGKYIEHSIHSSSSNVDVDDDYISGYNLDKNAYTQVSFIGKYGKFVIK